MEIDLNEIERRANAEYQLKKSTLPLPPPPPPPRQIREGVEIIKPEPVRRQHEVDTPNKNAFMPAANPAVVLELARRLKGAEKAAARMSEALQTIAAMQDHPYYKANPKETAKDAHLIASSAFASGASEMCGALQKAGGDI